MAYWPTWGISSHQIDSPERGFSTRYDGPLDMRMDTKGDLTAASLLNEYSEAELHKILGMYGEIKNAKTAAKMITQQRVSKPFSRTEDLKKALQTIAPRGKENKYFAQVFQALRIEVNQEMKALEDFLHQCGEVMAEGGRLGSDELPLAGRQAGEEFYKQGKGVWRGGERFLWK
jgi:16S rRNA (cytosine1402-N4)-methyltransferase